MQPLLNQEKLFFELTKQIMNDKNVSQVNMNQLSETTKNAHEFMKRLLNR